MPFVVSWNVSANRARLLQHSCCMRPGTRYADTSGLAGGPVKLERKLVARGLLSDPWGTWAALSIAGAAGLASEKTKLGTFHAQTTHTRAIKDDLQDRHDAPFSTEKERR